MFASVFPYADKRLINCSRIKNFLNYVTVMIHYNHSVMFSILSYIAFISGYPSQSGVHFVG